MKQEQARRIEAGEYANIMDDNSYDSELEAEFFGTCDPKINKNVFGEMERIQVELAKEKERLALEEQ